MKKFLVITVGIVGLSGCTTLSEPLSPDFGKANMAAYDRQIVTKTPGIGAPTPDQNVQSGAIERYQSDEVKIPGEKRESSSGD